MVAVIPFMRHSLARGLLPEDPPSRSIQGYNRKPLGLARCVNHVGVGTSRDGVRFDGDLPPGRDGRQDENLILPDDRRGGATARQGDLPLDIMGFTPFDGRVAMGRNAIGQRSAPLRPIQIPGGFACTGGAGAEHRGQTDTDIQNEAFHKHALQAGSRGLPLGSIYPVIPSDGKKTWMHLGFLYGSIHLPAWVFSRLGGEIFSKDWNWAGVGFPSLGQIKAILFRGLEKATRKVPSLGKD